MDIGGRLTSQIQKGLRRLLAFALAGALCSPIFSSNAIEVAVANPQAVQEQQTFDRQLVEGLIQRRLYQVAESLCRREMASAKPNSIDNALWTIDLIKVQAAYAANSQSRSPDSDWQEIKNTAEHFAKFFPDHPQLVLVQLQAALSSFSRGQLMRQEIQVSMRPPSDAAETIGILRDVTQQLSSLERKIQSMVASAPNDNVNRNVMTKSELLSLKTNIAVQLARCNIDRALLLPAEQELDRLDILRRAIGQLESAGRATDKTMLLWWEIQADLARVKRLQKDLNGANRILVGLNLAEAPPAHVVRQTLASLRWDRETERSAARPVRRPFEP